jgi:hypothetical protein
MSSRLPWRCWMLEAGLRPEVIGAVLEQLRKKRKRPLSEEKRFYLVISRQPETQSSRSRQPQMSRISGERFYTIDFLDDPSVDPTDLTELLELADGTDLGKLNLVLVAIGPLFAAIHKRLAEMNTEKEKGT